MVMDPRSADRDAARPTMNDVARSAGVSFLIDNAAGVFAGVPA